MLSTRGLEVDGYLQKINKWKNIALKKHTLPPFLIVFVTNKCNLRCRHCFYQGNIQNRKIEDLSISEFESLSRQFGKLYNVLISGGEPFLRKDLADICELFYRNSNVEKIAIPTNGFVPNATYSATKKILDTLHNIKLEINLSIDGPEDVHDGIRGVKGSFNRAIESCKLLLDLKERYRNLKCFVSTTISNVNFDQIPLFKRFIKEKLRGIDNHRFGFFRGTCKDEHLFFPKNKLKEVKKIINGNTKKGFDFYLGNIFLNAKLAVLKQGRQVVKCAAGELIGVIDNNGDVRLCELLKPIGNIRDKTFHDIWHCEAADSQRKSISQGKCYCTHECFIAPSMLYQPKNYFKVIRYCLK
jgi:MoaA/NifB/PqqE/SkfB family radical SAM enzyme